MTSFVFQNGVVIPLLVDSCVLNCLASETKALPTDDLERHSLAHNNESMFSLQSPDAEEKLSF